MNWDHFPKLQPVIFQPYAQMSFNQRRIYEMEQKFDFNYQKLFQKSFSKTKTALSTQSSQNQDKFQLLLRKIQKVKHEYQQDLNNEANLSYAPKGEELQLGTCNEGQSSQGSLYESGQKAKTTMSIKCEKNLENSTGSLKQKSLLYTQNREFLPIQKEFHKFPLYQQKHSRFNQESTNERLLSYQIHVPQNYLNLNKQNSFNFRGQNCESSKKNYTQARKTINIDMDILNKIPVRQSINFDVQYFQGFQNIAQFQKFFLTSKKQELKISDFQLGSCIGQGRFGQVYKCRHKKTNFICALKKILKSTILEYNMVDQFIRQLKISYMVDHPNVIKTFGHFHDDFHVFLLMEYAGDGCVIDNLKYNKCQQFSSKVLLQTLNAIDHLHKLKIVHRDIKPENIVVFFNDTYKICDFGLSAFVNNEMKRTFCGTADYLSPEMKDVGYYDTSVDLWSLGVLAYQLILGQPPFKEKKRISEQNKNERNKISHRSWQVEYPKELSQVSINFMKSLLKQHPEQRQKITDCLSHQFILGHNRKQAKYFRASEIGEFRITQLNEQ